MNYKLTLLLFILVSVIALRADEDGASLRESFFFDGIDDLIVVPDDESINSNSMTIMLEFKVLDTTSLKSGNNMTSQFILFKKNPMEHFNEGIAIHYDEKAKNITAVMSNTDKKQVYAYSKRGTIEPEKWYSVTVTADEEMLRLYLNGKEQKSNKTGFPLTFDNEPLLIGGRNNVILEKEKYGGMFSGELKNIKIYNKSLSEPDINKFIENSSEYEDNLVLDFSYNEQDGIIHDKYDKNNGIMLRGRPTRQEMKEPDYVLVSPNPAVSKTFVKFKLQYLTDLKIVIRDLSGAEIMSIHQGPLKKGEHNIAFDADSLKNGYYVCFLEEGSSIRTSSFIVAR
ncbi:MAG: LamG-like jellyroll fold domain-containing protein [Candidatus Kapaibacterium sp.]|jgi:hypothetical protein|nr:LamG-like jellyroll fold domain-containing protein [Candidatus Kapabacteria bacterium]